MVISFNLPDATLREVTDEANTRQLPPEAVLNRHIEVGRSIPYDARVIMLHGGALQALETRLVDGGMLRSAEHLVNQVARLARIEFGEYEIQLTPAQLEELAWRAKKRGKSVEQLIQEAWAKLQQELFTYANT